MTNPTTKSIADSFSPIESDAEWREQGWATESEPLTAAPRLGSTITVDFDPETTALIRQAARLRGLTRTEFVRVAAISAATNVTRKINSQS